MKAVVFGAGNIGRGFLGLLLSQSGYHTTFIDVDTARIDALNNQGHYTVSLVSSNGKQEETVRQVRGVHFTDEQGLKDAIVEADVILTAVGKNALSAVATSLSRGLFERTRRRPGTEAHIAVIACENVSDNTSYLLSLIREKTGPEAAARIESVSSFPNCVVDRIVPNTPAVDQPGLTGTRGEDALAVTVESYFQFAIDAKGLKAPPPPITGMEVSADLAAILEQKLLTLNMAHAITAYWGWMRKKQYIHEAVGDPALRSLLYGALEEVEMALTARHPSITPASQQAFAAKTITRFENPYLLDEVTRVGRDPARKLGPEDRLVKPARLLWNIGHVPSYISTGIAAALRYDYSGDKQAQELTTAIRLNGIDRVLAEVCGLERGSDLSRLVAAEIRFTQL